MLADRPLTDIPRLAALVAIATIPLEISKLFLPALGSSNLVDGRVASSLDVARLALLVAVATLAVSKTRELPLRPTHGVSALAAALTVLGAASVLWSATPLNTVVESVRLAFLVVGFGALVSIASQPGALPGYVNVLRMAMVAMAVAAVAQRVTGVYLWNLPLAPTGRANVTYADPNILARHLIVGIALTATAPVRRGPPLAMAVLFAGLLATGSRSSLVAVVAVLAYLAVRGRDIGARRSVQTLVLGGGVVVLLMALDSGIRDRLATLVRGNSLGPRPFLLRAGWNMFLDHPLGGVGLGAFANSYRVDYTDFFSYYGAAGVSSHTSAVTILAELGIAGVIVVSLLLALAFHRSPAVRRRPQIAAWRLGMEGALVGLIITSQSEGRLLEDPMLWVVLAAIVACDRMAAKPSTEDVATQPVRPLGVEPAPLLVGDIGRVEPPR